MGSSARQEKSINFLRMTTEKIPLFLRQIVSMLKEEQQIRLRLIAGASRTSYMEVSLPQRRWMTSGVDKERQG